jgi:glycosyltransferase involved in cell wall biosynthesis
MYDAFQVRDMPVLAAAAVVIARWKRRPLYYWMSYPMPEGQIELARQRRLSAGVMKFLYPWMSGHAGRWLLRHWVLRRASHLFVQSPAMKQELLALGVPGERITPVLMGVDLDALKPDELQAVEDPRLAGRRVIAYLGTLDRSRRIEGLFAMLSRVRLREPRALLLIVGDTDDDVHRRWLREQAQEAGVAEHVIWTGWLPTREGWRWLRTAEVALSPFPRGPLLDSASPTKVPEYLALGLPVVCNDNPDQRSVIEVSGAGRCVPYTPEDFADAVVELLNLPAGERERMRAAGLRYVQEHRDYRRIAEQVAAQYRRLAATAMQK